MSLLQKVELIDNNGEVIWNYSCFNSFSKRVAKAFAVLDALNNDVDFSNTTITGADFISTDLPKRRSLSGLTFENCLFQDNYWNDFNVDIPVVFSKTKFINCTFVSMVNQSAMLFTSSILKRCSFEGTLTQFGLDDTSVIDCKWYMDNVLITSVQGNTTIMNSSFHYNKSMQFEVLGSNVVITKTSIDLKQHKSDLVFEQAVIDQLFLTCSTNVCFKGTTIELSNIESVKTIVFDDHSLMTNGTLTFSNSENLVVKTSSIERVIIDGIRYDKHVGTYVPSTNSIPVHIMLNDDQIVSLEK